MLRPEFNLVCFKSLKYDSQSNKVCKFFWKYVNSIQGRDSKMGSEKLFYFCQLCIQYLRFANLAQIAELLMVKQPSKVFWKKKLFLIIHRETLALKSLFIKLQTWRGATLLKRIGALVLSYGYCKTFKSTFFEDYLRTAASVYGKFDNCHHKCSTKKVFFASLRPKMLLKKRLRHSSFTMNFGNFLRIHFWTPPAAASIYDSLDVSIYFNGLNR